MLNVFEIQALKKGSISDEKNGLSIRVLKSGSKIFYFRKKINGKDKTITLGNYPELTLAKARIQAKELYEKYTTIKEKINNIKEPTINELACLFLDKKSKELKLNTMRNLKRYINTITDYFNNQYISLISVSDVNLFLQRYTQSNTIKLQIARKVCLTLQQLEIFSFNSGYIKEVRFSYIHKTLVTHKAKNFTSIHYKDLPLLFSKLLGVSRWYKWESLCLIGMYTLLRPNEYHKLKWSWIDFKNDLIIIPSDQMKTNKIHKVPMTRQIKSILLDLYKTQSNKDFVFNNFKDKNRQILSTALCAFFNYNKLNNIICPHGFRSMGRTFFAENKVPFEVAEKCLAHNVGNSTERAYNRAELLEERKDVLQKWCDYVEKCYLTCEQIHKQQVK